MSQGGVTKWSNDMFLILGVCTGCLRKEDPPQKKKKKPKKNNVADYQYF